MPDLRTLTLDLAALEAAAASEHGSPAETDAAWLAAILRLVDETGASESAQDPAPDRAILRRL